MTRWEHLVLRVNAEGVSRDDLSKELGAHGGDGRELVSRRQGGGVPSFVFKRPRE